MRYFILISYLVLILASCEENNNSKMPEIPVNDTIDINIDSQDDFVISYSAIETMDIPPSGQSITGTIRPLGENQVLYRPDVGHLFLELDDTIRKEINVNSVWSDFSASVIGINGHHDEWENEWTIVSELSSGYFLGFKLRYDDVGEIGWMLLDLNTQNGHISITDFEITASDELIILE